MCYQYLRSIWGSIPSYHLFLCARILTSVSIVANICQIWETNIPQSLLDPYLCETFVSCDQCGSYIPLYGQTYGTNVPPFQDPQIPVEYTIPHKMYPLLISQSYCKWPSRNTGFKSPDKYLEHHLFFQNFKTVLRTKKTYT